MLSISQIFADTYAEVHININGDTPWDMQIHNHKLYDRIIRGGLVGFGEAYMNGWRDSKALYKFSWLYVRNIL